MLKTSSFLLFVVASADVELPIPGRKQWDNRGGYCGSCSLQQAALFFGNWISQDIVRKSVGDREVLPGVNEQRAAKALKFEVDVWNGDDIKSRCQYKYYMVWVKKHLLRRHPVIITLYLEDCSASEYDHIVPAIGIRTAHNDSSFHGEDVLIINNNYQKTSISHTFDEFRGTRKTCTRTEDTGGCIPAYRDWGVAVQGNIDENEELFPVQLFVDRWDEPNIVKHHESVQLMGTLSASGLNAGENYMLLRYSNGASVPTSGFASVSSQKAAVKVTHFVAKGATWRYTDPMGIPSGGAAFYRLVRVGSVGKSHGAVFQTDLSFII